MQERNCCQQGRDRAVTTLRDAKNISILTAQWLLGMISVIDPDRRGGPVQAHVREYDQVSPNLERKTSHMLVIDKHLISFTGADRHMTAL